jgi:hypothetical protein
VRRNGVAVFIATWHKEAFYELGSRMLQSLILTEALSSACWEKKEKKKKRERERSCQGLFFPVSEARHALLAVQCGFLQVLGTIKG